MEYPEPLARLTERSTSRHPARKLGRMVSHTILPFPPEFPACVATLTTTGSDADTVAHIDAIVN